ncbi:hypothetical protein [Zymomonas mobilis]|uniref:hypothetical protein n=1 Tax=Zymomonas mobilis TaxID=542 RepID=UPI0021C40A4F|nr:hypothetical protein [Zymomonas mobilis]MCP9308683.1 hypothetical protein [Zymomonas mobilis]
MFVEVKDKSGKSHFLNIHQIVEIKKFIGLHGKTYFRVQFTFGESIDIELPEDDIHYLLKDNLIK